MLDGQLKLGETRHAVFPGNFAAVSNVDLFLYGVPAVSSTDTNVINIDASGQVTATGLGTATVSADFGGFHGASVVSVVPAALTHRYSFSEPATSLTATDSVGGVAWSGTLNGNAMLDGSELVLDGAGSYAQLPAGIISGYSALSIETWASFGANGRWVRLWDFGDQKADGTGNSSIYFTPHNGSDTAQMTMFNPGSSSDVIYPTNLDNMSNMQVVGVYTGDRMQLYFNGALVGQNDAASLPVTANIDVNSFIGKSMFNPDPYVSATVDEFRIFQGALTPAEVASHYASGPDSLPTPAPTLAITLGQGVVTISWPTNGTAAYTLSSSASLTGGWSPYAGFIAVQNGENVATEAISAAPKFYRLQRGP